MAAPSVIMPVILIFFLGNSMVVSGDMELDFRVVPSFIKPLETVNMTLQCTVEKRFKQYEPWSGYYSNYWEDYGTSTSSPSTLGSYEGSVAIFRIMKNSQESWQPIAQMSFMEPTVVETLDPSITSSSGFISDDFRNQSFIEVTWAIANLDVFGNYRCDVIVFTRNQNEAAMRSSEISVGSDLDATDLLLLLQNEATDIMNKVDVLELSQKSNRNFTDQLQSDLLKLETAAKDKHNELEEQMKEENEVLVKREEGLERRISDMEKEITERVNDVNKKVRAAIDSGFLMFWPRGNYGFLKPKSGCPSETIENWKTGSRRHHTESTDRNEDSLSVDNHLWKSTLARENGNNFMTQYFCIKSESNNLGPFWPRGSYCINKKVNCPRSFNKGYVRWNDESGENLQTVNGEVPDGYFSDNDSTSIEYCCRQDAPADIPVYLPNSDPFYLYRYGGSCQQVHGMNATEEYMVFDTENTNNRDELGPVHPDGKINNVRLELCYYQLS